MINIETNQIYKQDCIQGMKDLINKGYSKSFDFIEIDPPYNIGKDVWDKFKSHEEYLEFIKEVIDLSSQLMSDNGTLFLWHNQFDSLCDIHYICKKNKLINKNLIVWNKLYEYNGDNNKIKAKMIYLKNRLLVDSDRSYNKGMTEYCLYYTFYDEKLDSDYFKSIRDYFWKEYELSGLTLKTANELMGLATTGANMAGELFGKKRKRFRFPTEEKYQLLQQSGYFQRPYEELKNEYENMRYVFNGSKNDERHCVWNYPISKEVGHMTEKPLQLYYDMFEVHTKKDSKCLFPFIGSGNNIISLLDINKANSGNREYIGFETDDKWFGLINERIDKIANNRMGL